ncbi:EpsG family protein [Priestia endophytica]|uniref:EpsG family protein n=1 Tax=Priestia endophytica TaxID=135735 RepID=UPI003D2C6B01
MLTYLTLIFVVFYFLFVSRLVLVRQQISNNREIFIFRSNIVLYIWFIILLCLAVFRDIDVGTDYGMYYSFFMNESYSGAEVGIGYLYDLAVKYDSFLIFSTGIYLIFLFFVFRAIRKNCPNYIISLLFFVITYLYFTSYNQLRQIVAASLIFYFITYLLNNNRLNKLKFLIVVLVALLFHNSAIFLLLLFLVPKKRISPKIVITLFTLTIILYFIPEFKNYIGQLITNISGFYASKYEQNLDYFFEVNKEKGMLQLMPVIIQMFIIVMSLYIKSGDKKLNINYKLYDISTNIIVVNLCLYSLSGIEAIDRLQVYLSFFNIYFYSFLIHILLNSKDVLYKRFFVTFIFFFWIMYYILRLKNNIQGIVPYSF